MEGSDTRTFIRKLRKHLKEIGLDCVVVKQGRNSGHQGLLIRDPKTDQQVLLIIARRRTLTPEVRRRILAFLKRMAARLAAAAAIEEVFRQLFD